MGEDKHKQSSDSISRWWGIWVLICTAPLYFLFSHYGDPGRGQAATIGAGAVIFAARLLWDLRAYAWCWVTIAMIVAYHVPLIALIPWPFKQYSYMQLLPLGLLDLAVAYGIIRAVEKVMARLHEREGTTTRR